MTIEIGVILPTSTPDPSAPILGDVSASAAFAEQIGLDSVWSTDHLIASAPILDGTIVGNDTNTAVIPSTPMHWVIQTETTPGGPDNTAAGNVQIDWLAMYSRQ